MNRDYSMSEKLHQRVYHIFADAIEGGCSEDMTSILDRAIEEGELTNVEYCDNEMGIAVLFDTYWFTCEGCGWTLPINDMQDGHDGDDSWICQGCKDD